MLALIVLGLTVGSLVAVWRRFGIASCRPGRVALVAVLGGFLGAFALYATLSLYPPAWLIAVSDVLLLFPLVLLTGSTNETVLSLLAPALLGVEFGVVIFCILVGVRRVLRAGQHRKELAE
jgi:hypothetical protein